MIFGIIDLAQIEARILSWIAGQDDLLKGFANGEDVYSEFATDLFCCPVRKARKTDPEEVGKVLTIRRGFGKDAILGCIAKGSRILTNTGWKPIETITTNDLLWDGRNWVNHQGIIEKGKKKCVLVNGIWMTPEHEIFNLGEWTTALELSISNQKLGTAMESLQLLELNMESAKELSPSNVVAPVVESLLQQEIIWSKGNLHAVMSVLKRHPAKLRATKHLLNSHIRVDYLIEFVQSLADVKQDHIKIMVSEVLESGLIGSQIELLFLNIWHHYRDGIIQSLRSTGLTITKDMSLVISDLLPGLKTCETVDILYSGDYKRFQAGNLICSNCGYGMGAQKFFDRCLSNVTLKPMFDSGKYSFAFIEKLIKTYRAKYSMIPAFWTNIEKAFRWVVKYPHEHKSIPFFELWNNSGTVNIQLPSTRCLKYPEARIVKDKWNGKLKYKKHYLWGGAITENVVQAIARDIFVEGVLRLDAANIPVILRSHDEVVILLSEKNAKKKLQKAIDVFCYKPSWAQGLCIAGEGELSRYYRK